MKESLKDGAIAVLEQCGPRRRSNADGPINLQAKRWMMELLDEPDGAIGIAEAIIGVWEAHHGAKCLLSEKQPAKAL